MDDERIYQGVDCTKSRFNPQLDQEIIVTKLHEPYHNCRTLAVQWPHPQEDCPDYCHTWEKITGLGYIDPRQGLETVYYAPKDIPNAYCEGNPTIHLFYGPKRIAKRTIYLVTYNPQNIWAYEFHGLESHWTWWPKDESWAAQQTPVAPSWIKGSSINCYYVVEQRRCDDSTFNTYWHPQYILPCSWNTRKRRYEFVDTSRGGVAFATPAEAFAYFKSVHDPRRPFVDDTRTEASKAKGCCPKGIAELT